MKNKKYSERDGYGIYTTDFQATDGRLQKTGNWIAENSMEILILALFAGMVAGTGMLLHTTTVAADILIEYVELEEDNYQEEKVLEAITAQRMEKLAEESVEQPPYWTVESY